MMALSKAKSAPLLFFFVFIGFFVGNFLFRWPAILDFGFVNEDGSILRGSVAEWNRHSLMYWFSHPLGTAMVRPIHVMGLAIQGWLFGSSSSLPYHIWSICVLSVAQSFLVIGLLSHFRVCSAVIGVSLLSLARASGEPVHWIADQHDLYLLLFMSLGVYSLQKFRGIYREGMVFFFLLSACLCNEKGVVLPLLLGVYRYGIARHAGVKTQLHEAIASALQLLSVVALYFAYRYWVIGAFVGGYDDRIFPDERWGSSRILHFIFSLGTVPVQQAHSLETGMGVISIALLLIVYLIRVRRPFYELGVGAFILVVSSVPTYRFMPLFPHGDIADTRLFWMPLIVWSIYLVVIIESFSRERTYRRNFGVFVCLLVLVLSGVGGRYGAVQFAAASQTSRYAAEVFMQHCDCAGGGNGSIRGLPLKSHSVYVFSEEQWLSDLLLWKGFPQCRAESEASCKLEYRYSKEEVLSVIPFRASLTQRIQNLPELVHVSEELNRYDVTLRKFHNRSFFRGVLREGYLAEPNTRIVLFSDGQPVVSTVLQHRKSEALNDTLFFLIGLSKQQLSAKELVVVEGVGDQSLSQAQIIYKHKLREGAPSPDLLSGMAY
ncbi:MAG: hypothetical protein KDD60_05100 [Bdellovibrionales bacterium]|nr:hypothetical protein [Bdellovibrionales bacterium]